MLEIEFKRISKKLIKIMGVKNINHNGKEKTIKKEIGRIFTPSGSGDDKLNAIQVCGFVEAFDLWGCGVYGIKKRLFELQDKNIKVKIFPTPYEQVKDIQLMFDMDVESHIVKCSVIDNCCRCFNEPCTCEISTKYENPYTVKREQDLRLEKKAMNND